MAEIKGSPLRRTRFLQAQIDEFLDVVSQAVLAYEAGVADYLQHGWSDAVEEKSVQIRECESRGDRLRSDIGTALYTEMLLPDTVGDVLSLLGALDHLLDVIKTNIIMLRVERPAFGPGLHGGTREMLRAACETVEQTVLASRSYFRDPATARDHHHKIHFYEDEAEHAACGSWRPSTRRTCPWRRNASCGSRSCASTGWRISRTTREMRSPSTR
jgi:uncharacterized protein Yka (UPF0111/DUF47 family)